MREFKLDKIKATGTTAGDVHFPKVKLLLPFNGSNGATSTTDSSNSNNSVTFVGTAQISTAQSKFGGSSMLFDGDSDYLTVTNSSFSTFNASGATFTIEFWVYFNSISGQQDFVMNYANSSGGLIIRKTTGHVIQTNLSGDGDDITGTTTVSTGQWYHVALSGSSGSYKLFLNGTQEGSTYTGSLGAGSSTYQIGAFYWSGNLYGPLNGYLDDMRFTAGLARYTSNFTPPTTAHSTSAGDVNKHIVVNSDADGVAIGTGGINQARIAKAWVHFDGTAVTTLESYNISSVTDRGTGLYKINFSTNMTSTSYTAAGTVSTGSDQTTPFVIRGTTYATDGFSFVTNYSGTSSIGYSDPNDVTVTVFGN